MKCEAEWVSTKYVYRRGKLRASFNPVHLNPASRVMADAVARRYQTELSIHAGGRLLDLGCGQVPLFAAYRNLVRETVCVDWTKNSKYLDLEWDVSKPLPFSDEGMDTVLLSDVLEHVVEPAALCAEISRVLKPGGKLLLNVPFFYWLHEEPHDYYRLTEHALRLFCKKAGLRVLSLEAVGGLPEILADIAAKVLGGLPGGGIGAGIVYLLARMASHVPGWRILSQRSARRFPLGYFLVAQKN